MKINSKQKGNAYERKIVNELKSLGFKQASTSRYTNKRLDDQKVDIDGIPLLNVQCKATERVGNMHTILKEMPRDGKCNVVFHKRNRQGSVVTMTKEDFYALIKKVTSV